MRVILSVDAIFPPLTGIGRYAWELATRLPAVAEIEELRYFGYGKWINDPATLIYQEAGGTEATGWQKVWPAVRRGLASSPLAVKGYAKLTPHVYRHRLKNYQDWLFHSPNFFLPPFQGRAVTTFHDLSIYRYPEYHPVARVEFMRGEMPKAARRASHIITDSEAIRQEVMDLFSVPGDRITVVPIGVDENFCPRLPCETTAVLEQYGLSYGRYTLCVATIEPRKNISNLLTAYRQLPFGLRLQYPLVLVGDRGWNSEVIHEKILVGEIEGWVKYLGYTPQKHLPYLYAGARGFAMISHYEGFGLPVLEAMASGIPVVTSNISSLPEVARDAGLLVSPLDVDAIAEALYRTLEDDVWRDIAIHRGLEIAEEMTWDACVRRTMDIYRLV